MVCFWCILGAVLVCVSVVLLVVLELLHATTPALHIICIVFIVYVSLIASL